MMTWSGATRTMGPGDGILSSGLLLSEGKSPTIFAVKFFLFLVHIVPQDLAYKPQPGDRGQERSGELGARMEPSRIDDPEDPVYDQPGQKVGENCEDCHCFASFKYQRKEILPRVATLEVTQVVSGLSPVPFNRIKTDNALASSRNRLPISFKATALVIPFATPHCGWYRQLMS